MCEQKIGSIRRVFEGALLKLGNPSLSQDEFHTLMLEAASIVNATPLWEVSANPNDPFPLTPARILTLKDGPNPELQSFSEADVLAYGKRRWRRVQSLATEFWHQWRSQYLSSLQERRKRTTERPPIQEGDVVLIRDKTAQRNSWPMALVESVKKSSDGRVRSAIVLSSKVGIKGNTKKHWYERPTCELVVLVIMRTDKAKMIIK